MNIKVYDEKMLSKMKKKYFFFAENKINRTVRIIEKLLIFTGRKEVNRHYES